MDQYTFTQLIVALGLGLLAGLQRETTQSRIAGMRTFALIAILGLLSGWLAKGLCAPIILVAGVASLAFLLFIANYLKSLSDTPDAGLTTEIAVLVMYLLCAYLAWGHITEVVVLGGIVALLLYLKGPLRQFARKLGEADLRAIFQFVALSLVILPILPNKTYGPYQVLNPFEIWLMVVLITGIGLTGYFAWKWLGHKSGTIVTGLLGGLISSTATTLSYARRCREAPTLIPVANLIILLASAVSIVRVIIEIAMVAPSHARQMLPALFLLLSVASFIVWWYYRKLEHMPVIVRPTHENPAELKSALIFGLLYGLIIWAVAASQAHWGESGLAVVSFLSGLTDMDAITLSLANSVNQRRLYPSEGSRYILLATASNTLFKGALATLIGGSTLGRKLAIPFGALVATALSLAFL